MTETPLAELLAYVGRSQGYWIQAQEQLDLGHLEKAAELAWGSVAERLKALALARTGTFLRSHGAIRSFVRKIASQLNDVDLYQAFRQAESLHIEFYESHFDIDEVRQAFAQVDTLLRKIDSYFPRGRTLS